MLSLSVQNIRLIVKKVLQTFSIIHRLSNHLSTRQRHRWTIRHRNCREIILRAQNLLRIALRVFGRHRLSFKQRRRPLQTSQTLQHPRPYQILMFQPFNRWLSIHRLRNLSKQPLRRHQRRHPTNRSFETLLGHILATLKRHETFGQKQIHFNHQMLEIHRCHHRQWRETWTKAIIRRSI